MPNEPLTDRILRKCRDEMTRQRLSQLDVANLLGRSQSWVAKLLNKRVGMGVDDLEALCFALSLSLTEIVRQEGYEFVADLTPTELQVLEAFRRQPQGTKDAIAHLLRVPVSQSGTDKRAIGRRRAKP